MARSSCRAPMIRAAPQPVGKLRVRLAGHEVVDPRKARLALEAVTGSTARATAAKLGVPRYQLRLAAVAMQRARPAVALGGADHQAAHATLRLPSFIQD